METVPDPSLVLKDRSDAGRRLAEKVEEFRGEKPVVVAAHRGGTPVAFEVAQSLGAPLDVVVVREVSLPDVPGKVLCAVAEGNTTVMDRLAVEESGASAADVQPEAERTLREVERAAITFREGRPPVDVKGRTVLLVADGIAHSVSMRAAILAVRARGARKVVAAIGVCSRPTTQEIRRECDEIIVLRQPEFFLSVGEWYRNYPPVTEDEVLSFLRRAGTHSATAGAAGSVSGHRTESQDTARG
jgi:putative phosphoribosyl transferase